MDIGGSKGLEWGLAAILRKSSDRETHRIEIQVLSFLCSESFQGPRELREHVISQLACSSLDGCETES